MVFPESRHLAVCLLAQFSNSPDNFYLLAHVQAFRFAVKGVFVRGFWALRQGAPRAAVIC